MGDLLHRFWSDDQIQIFVFLIVLDLLLGVAASVKQKDFRLSYVADFARNDLLGKVLPAFLVYGGYVFAKNSDIVIPGFDMEIVMRAAVGIAMAAMVGSLFKSLRDFGFARDSDSPIVAAVAGPDPETPPIPPAVVVLPPDEPRP